MKKLILAAVTGVICSASLANSANDYAVTDAMYHLAAAMMSGNETQMQELTHASLTYGYSDGSVQNKTAFVDTIVSRQTRYRRIDLTDAKTTVAGDNAIVREHFSATTELGGKFDELDLNELLVWHRHNGKWRLLARQGYKF
ncbi:MULTISPECIES: nuclear transport factor 2 family protein [Paraburkholderia]|uniref:nuclear transport factor 2 family protein n=1 Tax=Paraburkholderia TaxID=1822464 RepID=UPI0015C61310|nr:nuclear transport factor 2 family protein [Paraburkholderia caledonica]